MRSNLIDIEARLIHETEKAWKLDTGGENPGIQPEIMADIALEMMARGARLVVSAIETGPHPSSVAYGPEVGRVIAADAAKLAAVRALIDGQTRHNCGLVRQLREMLG